MKFETKFALGQRVHVFARRHNELFDVCPSCDGRGKVNYALADGSPAETYCPNCRTGRVRSVWHDVWEYAGTARIGRVEILAYDGDLAPRYAEKAYEEKYMLDTTGIGTGTVYSFDGRGWSHTNLFATHEEGETWAAEANEPLWAEAAEKRTRMAAEALA